MKNTYISLAACLATLLGTGATAAVSPEEARQLGAKLTPFGAEKAANADGSIPAYSAAPTPAPAGYKPGSGHFVDPFPNEKPLTSIDQKSMAKYADQLTEGTKALMQRFPTFRADVYPTHRTQRYSKWEVDAIGKNAVTAELVEGGDGVRNSYGPVPFPIPKDGYEVLWNHYNRAEAPATQFRASSYLVDASGRPNLIGDLGLKSNRAISDKSKTALEGPYKQKVIIRYFGPPAQVGEQVLWFYSQDYSKSGQIFYTYTPGQRRVRIAPEFAYDTPVASYGGAIVYDEISLFEGRPDRFNFKLVGKKEIIVPYNNNRMSEASVQIDQLIGAKHINPDLVRWEKHRVWVVEATLKPGKRHVYSKRRLYVDEDTWAILASESYDQGERLYRVGFMSPVLMYDSGRNWCNSFMMYDLVKNNYVLANWVGGNPRNFLKGQDELFNASEFTPDAMQSSGVR